MFFQQGHFYIAGANVPVFVSDDMLRKGGTDNGFAEIQIVDRDNFPISQLPSGIPGSDWDTVLMGRRVAPDGTVDLPSEVKWVVDTTPSIVIAGQTSTPPSSASPPFFPFPERPTSTPTGEPMSVPQGIALPLMVGMGVIGGAFLGWHGVKHMFSEGLTDKERKNILLYGASVLAVWGVSQLLSLEKAWWLTPEGAAQRAEQELIP